MQLLKHLANAMPRAEGFVLERALVVVWYMSSSTGCSSGDSGGSDGIVAVCLGSVIDGTGSNPASPFYFSFFLASSFIPEKFLIFLPDL